MPIKIAGKPIIIRNPILRYTAGTFVAVGKPVLVVVGLSLLGWLVHLLFGFQIFQISGPSFISYLVLGFFSVVALVAAALTLLILVGIGQEAAKRIRDLSNRLFGEQEEKKPNSSPSGKNAVSNFFSSLDD